MTNNLIPLFAAIWRWFSVPQTALYRNPVLPGDFPDPSIIRVNERDFYAATTSTDWAPEFPIFHSRDLITWTLAGAVFSQRPSWAVGNFWAPEFTEFGGRYFIYYVARRNAGPLCVAVASANHPAGPYLDHGPLVGQNDGSIDPMATIDEHGQRWLIWKEDGNSANRPTPIWGQRLSADGLVLWGEKHELIRNDAAWEGHVVEAPVVFRRDGWFFMLYSGNGCCGADCRYAVGAARSRSLLGPWKKCPRNPILAGNDLFRCPGHGSTVTVGASGRMYFVYHAYSVAADSVYIGRQILLDAVDWESDGWPAINGGHGPSDTAGAPFAQLRERTAHRFFQGFTNAALGSGWQWPQDAAPRTRVDPERGGHLVLGTPASSSCDPLAAVIARPVMNGDYVATTAVDAGALATDTVASLTAYGDRRNALGLAVRNAQVVLWRRKRGKIVVVWRRAVPNAATIQLRMRVAGGHRYSFAFSFDGRDWETCGTTVDGAHVPPWDRGVRVALTVGGVPAAEARFDFLRICTSRMAIALPADRKRHFERHRLRQRRLAASA